VLPESGKIFAGILQAVREQRVECQVHELQVGIEQSLKKYAHDDG
jgi:hypothetical protein